jgi:hypothetical protein
MKSKEEIEQLAEKNFPIEEYPTNQGFEHFAYKQGYTQCQQNMAKELEMHILLNEHDWSRNPQAQLKDFFNSKKKGNEK